MTHDVWREYGTYLGQHANNKTVVKFRRGKNTASKKGVMISKVSNTATSTKDVSQSRLSNESDILLITFGPSERTQYQNKKVLDQGEFINFQLLFRHKYYASYHMHYLA